MRTGVYRCFFAVIFFCTLLTGCAQAATSGGLEDESLVIMVYMIGSDLESDNRLASADIQEMLQARIDVGTKVFLMAGGSPSWGMEISTEELPIYQISEHRLQLLDELPLCSMAEPGTLSSFMQYVYDREPGGRYALILWDHGMGPMEGYGVDLLFGRDHMSLNGLSTALEDSPFSENNRLLWIGFDACLMASLETVSAVKDYAYYMLASQEVEPRNGWDYSFLEFLTPQMPAEEQLEQVKTAYLSYYEKLCFSLPNYKPTLTLSCLNLHATEEVVSTLDELLTAQNDIFSSEKLAAYSRLRSSAVSIGHFTNGVNYDLIDLTEFIRLFYENSSTQCDDLRYALSKLIVWSAGNVDYAKGVSIYCPSENIEAYFFAWREIFSELSASEEYYCFMDHMVMAEQANVSDCFDTELIPIVELTENGYSISLNLSEEQERYYARSNIWILAEEELHSWDNGENEIWLVPAAVFSGNEYNAAQRQICATFDGNLLYSADSSGKEFFIYILSPDHHRCISYCMLDKPYDLILEGYDFDDLYLYCELQIEIDEDGKAEVIGAILDIDDEVDFERRYAQGKKELNLNEWSGIEFYSLVFSPTESGHVKQTDYVAVQRYDISGEIEISTRRADVPLYAMFLITDLAGNQYETQIVPLCP